MKKEELKQKAIEGFNKRLLSLGNGRFNLEILDFLRYHQDELEKAVREEVI